MTKKLLFGDKSIFPYWRGKIFRLMNLFLLMFLVASVVDLYAADSKVKSNIEYQQRTVTGKVTDVGGNPLPGVNVVVQGTTVGTITDVDGNYSLQIPSDAQVLVFSFIGMTAQQIELGSATVYDVALRETAVDLDEVVVVGYGTVLRSDLTGSVSRVQAEQIRDMAPTQVTESLSGTVAGLYSNQGAAASGGGSLEIRGPSSLSAETSPLIVLDGVIYQGSMSEINPADIETIDVLRDASSAAIFGARAANGVILITTKRGQTGKPVITFSAKVGRSTTTNDFYPYGMDPDGDPMEYFDMHRDHLWNRSNFTFPYYYYWRPEDLPGDVSVQEWLGYVQNPNSDPTEEWLSRIAAWPIERENYKAGKITNFYDLCINPGIRQDYNLGVGGGTENISYYWSIGYLDNEGIIVGDQFSAIRTRINLDLEVAEWLKVGTNSQFTNRDESVVQASLSLLGQMSPYGSMYEPDGSLKWYPNDYTGAIENPLLDYYGRDRLRDINSLSSSLYAELTLPFGITYRISYQPRFSFLKEFNYYSTNTPTGRNTYKGGYGYRTNDNAYNWMLDNLIKWNKTFGVHNFDVTLLANAERNQSWSSNQYSSDFAPNENLTWHALQFGANPRVSDTDNASSGDALLARLNYTLKDKYLLTASVRRDGYSAFGQLNPRATFPAFALAWKVSDEPFWKSSFMNRLKVRASWGENGNREIGAYSALAQLGSITYFNSNNQVQTGVYNTRLANPNLRWERTESFNVGLDMGFLDNRIDITLDAYDAVTEDLLLNRQLPRITGFSSITTNLGKLGNRGIEATINTVNMSRPNIKWRSTLVFSMNRNKILELWGDYGDYKLLNEERYGELPDFANFWFPGYARDIVWNYERIGIWQMDEMDEAAKYQLQPGDYKVTDVNGDFKMTQFEDRKFIGYTAPRHRWGFTNEVDLYKNISISLFIRADLGHIRDVPITGNKSTHDRRNEWAWGYWSPENPTAEFQKNNWPDNTSRFGLGITPYIPTGFLRVQDLSISYNVPQDKLQRVLPLQSLRILLTGRNLYTITNWKGFDPESANTPMPKTLTLGVDISL